MNQFFCPVTTGSPPRFQTGLVIYRC